MSHILPCLWMNNNIKEAIELCLEDMGARGEPIPDPSGTLIGSVVVTR